MLPVIVARETCQLEKRCFGVLFYRGGGSGHWWETRSGPEVCLGICGFDASCDSETLSLSDNGLLARLVMHRTGQTCGGSCCCSSDSRTGAGGLGTGGCVGGAIAHTGTIASDTATATATAAAAATDNTIIPVVMFIPAAIGDTHSDNPLSRMPTLWPRSSPRSTRSL